MADVFISYRNTPERRMLVRRLATVLRMNGIDAWWDYGLEAGESFRAQITEALSSARLVVPLWCEQSVASQWVLMEAELGKDKLVPARLQSITPPETFATIQSANLIEWDGGVDHPGLAGLVSKLRTKLGLTRPVPLDLLDELRSLPKLLPLPKPIEKPAATPPRADLLGDLRHTWSSLASKDSINTVERYLTHVRSIEPLSGLAFEIEARLAALQAEAAHQREMEALARQKEAERAQREASVREWKVMLSATAETIADRFRRKEEFQGDFLDWLSRFVQSEIPPAPFPEVAAEGDRIFSAQRLMMFEAMHPNDGPPDYDYVKLSYSVPPELANDPRTQAGRIPFCRLPAVIRMQEVRHWLFNIRSPGENEGYPKTTVLRQADVAWDSE